MQYPGYIVTGGGRTGSHWLEQIVKFITDYQGQDLSALSDRDWVAHTNELEDLTALDPRIKQDCALLIIRRQDTFAQAMSYAMAEHTNEWFSYTGRSVEPFAVDPAAFRARQQGCQAWDRRFDTEVRGLYRHVIDFEYEELVAQIHRVEDHVAQRLGMVNPHGHKDWNVNRNPRDYRRLVLNHRDLGG